MKAYTVKYRRKRNGKTDYRSRIALLSSNKIRVIIRKSLNNHYVQLMKFNTKGDISITSASTQELKKLGWKMHCGNLPSAYLTGYMAGLKSLKKGIKDGILDIGLARAVKGSSYYAALKGLIDSGFKINCNPKVIPNEDLITGKNIEQYAKVLQEKNEQYVKQFSKY